MAFVRFVPYRFPKSRAASRPDIPLGSDRAISWIVLTRCEPYNPLSITSACATETYGLLPPLLAFPELNQLQSEICGKGGSLISEVSRK